MHIERFLHNMLSLVTHKKRLVTLSIFVMATIKWKKLSVTNLGRNSGLAIQERSSIRRSDRFLSNKHLHAERAAIYQTIINRLTRNKLNPKIIVDWSPIPNVTHHVLRAALMVEGRALTLYEEVHPEKKLGNAKIQNQFLHRLKSYLHKECKPVIVTDAGFHNEWFSKVVELKWDYIGRIRGSKTYKLKNKTNKWCSIKTLLSGGTIEPEYIGCIELCFSNPLKTNLYRMKQIPKKRSSLNKNGQKRIDKKSKECSKSANESWLLATSLPHINHITAKRVMKIYKNRMQIEEAFRDLKSHKFGFSFEDTHSKRIKRIEILLLIGMLGSLIAWLIGYIAENKKLQYQFQANSIKKHRVLSLFFLGCQIVRKNIVFLLNELEEALIDVNNHNAMIL